MTIIRDESLDAYHARKGTVSNSRLKVFRESPLLYRKTFIDGTIARPDSKALRAGRAFDCLLFEGREAYHKQYASTPRFYPAEDEKTGETINKPWNGNANYCKAWLRSRGMYAQTVIDGNDAVAFEAMLQAITHHPLASLLFGMGEAQVTFRRASERFGLEVQVRPDWFSEQPIHLVDTMQRVVLTSNGLPWMLDLKTTADFGAWFDPLDPESPRAGKPVWDFGYHRQGGMAQWCAFQDVGRTAHFLLVVEKVEPFRVGVIQLDDAFLEIGWGEVEADLLRLKNCTTADKWPGSPEHLITLKPPQWLLDAAVRQSVAATDAGVPIGQQGAA